MRQVSTTHPSASTDRGPGGGRATHVHWVFPAPRIMALAGVKVVGRDETCDLVLPGNEISRRHAEFRVDGPITAVRDLGSRNGVFVNGEKLADAPIVAGDVIRCGEMIGIVVSAAAEPRQLAEIAPGWYGGSALQDAVAPARRIAIDLPIVVQGETGTGKEGMARALHAWSGRP